MSNVSVYNMEGKEVGTLELNDAVFGVEVNEHLVHLAVVRQLANNRQGTQKAKTRSEVSGGGRKPWRQKGTGHARQGSTRAPQWTGGGVVFAPTPRDYSLKMNKKERYAECTEQPERSKSYGCNRQRKRNRICKKHSECNHSFCRYSECIRYPEIQHSCSG